MDDARLILTDETRGRLAAVIREAEAPSGAPPRLPDRDFVEAVLYPARAGRPRRDLPPRFGEWRAAYRRSRRREETGVATGSSGRSAG